MSPVQMVGSLGTRSYGVMVASNPAMVMVAPSGIVQLELPKVFTVTRNGAATRRLYGTDPAHQTLCRGMRG